jgi:hypothetical protein
MRIVSPKSKWLAGLILVTVIALLFGGCWLSNELPIIDSLNLLTTDELNPGEACQVECIALDPDEDELSYSWSADAGSLSGEGATVQWTAPDAAGTYTISVEVDDGNGGIASDQIIVGVLVPNNPPVIWSVDPEWKRLKKASNTPVVCLAADPDGDELSYSWTATDGEGNPAGSFTGEGDTVTWFAPNAYGTYGITVTVSDGRGGEVSDTTTVIVCSCGSAH